MSGLSFEKLVGLSQDEVVERQKRDGFNELPTQGKRTAIDILIEVLREPMFLLLIACGALYLLSGEIQEAMMLLGFVFVIIGITFYQERKTERALEALKDLSSPRAYVIRNGEKTRIAGRDVVCDDVILLSEGDRVPADCILLHAVNFSVDESLLTGESVPVRKSSTQDASTVIGEPGGDEFFSTFSGTLVVSGQAAGIVRAIGTGTELGKIGNALLSIKEERTPLQIQTGKVVRTFALVGGILCILGGCRVLADSRQPARRIPCRAVAGDASRRVSGCSYGFFRSRRMADFKTSGAYPAGSRNRNARLRNRALR